MRKSFFQASMMLSAALFFIPLSQAQPVGEQMIDSVEISKGSTPCDPDLSIITMNFPVRYLNHYPQVASDEVRIRIRPLRVSQIDASELEERESRTPDRRIDSLLHEVIYEGDFRGGPYLTMIYKSAVRSRVIQGSDYRTIKVIMYPPEHSLDPACNNN